MNLILTVSSTSIVFIKGKRDDRTDWIATTQTTERIGLKFGVSDRYCDAGVGFLKVFKTGVK